MKHTQNGSSPWRRLSDSHRPDRLRFVKLQ